MMMHSEFLVFFAVSSVISGVQAKVNTWGNSARPVSDRNLKSKHNFSKGTARKSEFNSTQTFESVKSSEALEPVPFFEMLKEFNKHQDHIIDSMRIYNKDASKNKHQLRNTLRKLEENKKLREKYFENKENEHNYELSELENQVIKKKLEAQEMRAKTREIIQKRDELVTNNEKSDDIKKMEAKVAEAKKELQAILTRKQDRNSQIMNKLKLLDEIKHKKVEAQDEIDDLELKIERLQERKQHSYFFYKRYLHNQMQELKGNIRVFCRVRPALPGIDNPKDFVFEKGLDELMRFPDFQSIEINAEPDDMPSSRSKKSNNALTSQMFKFDAVFGASSTQDDIFKEVSELVISALDGYKVCIFAYGQTGSGKTYTMEGEFEEPDQKGIIPRSVEILFEHINNYKETGWEFSIKANFQEIYLEQIRDLLLPSNSMKHLNKCTKYEPTIVEVNEAEDVYYLLSKARENRMVADTECNGRSSRSHSLFQLQINGYHPKIRGGTTIDGALNLIDLAGSERLHKSKAEGERMKEAMSINKSLSCLGHVISALANKDKHIPYRDSKLTYILKEHIGSESAKTLMIVNISPLASYLTESVNSLRFASKVNSCIINSRKHD